jgi:hypothetical protein
MLGLPLFIWGIVMYLFEDKPGSLHPSLKSDIDEIYRYRLPIANPDY